MYIYGSTASSLCVHIQLCLGHIVLIYSKLLVQTINSFSFEENIETYIKLGRDSDRYIKFDQGAI